LELIVWHCTKIYRSMVRFVLYTYGKALDFNEHVTNCTDDVKNFIPIFSILENIFAEGTHEVVCWRKNGAVEQMWI
jgi:hypothetical protein